MKKVFSFIAFATLLLAGCSQDDYVGATVDTASATDGAEISFGSLKGNVTRAQIDGSAAAEILEGKFQVYGTKKVSDDVSNVFAQSDATEGISDDKTYYVWWANNANTTTSNTKGWEYVGNSGEITPATDDNDKFTLSSAQTIKYWDYSASQYDFIAYANTKGATISNDITTKGFTVSGGSTAIAGLYLADSKQVVTDDYNKVVTFQFRCAAAKVRLGIYETVPGYSVTSMTFYYGNNSSETNAYLDGTFVDGTNSHEYTVSYDDDGIAVLTPSGTNYTSTCFDFGSFSATNGLGTSSTDPTWAGGDGDYTAAIPNINDETISAMTLKVDYKLTSDDDSGETITVSGATAIVPAEYMKWQSNYAYTYLFKISDNTNGTTGGDGDPVGLYPITFDACVITEDGDTEYGTITTVTNPSITTYQKNSVSTDGIAYTNSSDSIYVTVYDNTSEELVSLSSSNLKLYYVGTVDNDTTEADLKKNAPTDDKSDNYLSIPSDKVTVNGQTFDVGKCAAIYYASGIPVGTYAVEYIDSENKYYKVIVVSESSGSE